MDNRDDVPIYFVGDFQDSSELGSVYASTSSGLTEHTMSTLTSDTVSEYFREINGRMFPVDENIPTVFPVDESEIRRLKLQHLLLKLVLGSNCFGPMREVLSGDPSGRRKRVLDLFTADGTWVREMAAEFPQVDFTSVDIVPLVPHPRCANILGYEVYDVYNGIAEADDTFDVIHLRYSMSKVNITPSYTITRRTPTPDLALITSLIWVPQIRQLPSLMRELHRVLRSGGLFLYGEYENEVFDASTEDHSATDTAPYMVHASRLSREAFDRQGVHAYAFKDVPRLIDPECELWSGEIQRKGFVNVTKEEKVVPAGQWPQLSHLREVGLITQYVWCEMWKSLRPLFINHGMTSQEADELVNGAMVELMNPGPRRLYAKYHVLSAFKPM